MSLSIDDRAAIEELSTRYSHCVNCGDVDGVMTVFTENVHFECQLKSWVVHLERFPAMRLRLVGRPALHDFFRSPEETGTAQGKLSSSPGPSQELGRDLGIHLSTRHSIVEGDGESATVAGYLADQDLEGSPRQTAHRRMRDQLIKTRGEWKIARRSLDIEPDDGKITASDFGARSEEVAASADPIAGSGTATAPNAEAAAPSLSAEDRASIFGIYARYRDAADSGDFENLLLLFARDAHFEGPLEWWAQHVDEQRDLRLRRLGLREVRQHFEVGRSLVKEDHGPSNRLIPQALRLPMAHSIEGDGESAAMASYFTFQYVDDPMRMLAYGQYLDRLEKTNQEWKIAHRFVDIQWDGRDPI